MRYRCLLLTVALMASLASVGCSGASSVSGQVTYDGHLVEEGHITFAPVDGKGPVVGSPIRNGRFTVAAIGSGTKLVKIEAVKQVDFAANTEEMERLSREGKTRGEGSGLLDPADAIPMNAIGNHAVVEVRRGHQKQDFQLQKPGPRGS